MTTPPPISTRPLSGLPTWPIGLVAGVEKSGKTLEIVRAATSDLVHLTYWVGCGEDVPEEYGAYPGAQERIRYVNHDGTYQGIRNALRSARLQPVGPNGEPNLLVLDSAGRTWDLLKDMAQAEQRGRQARKGAEATIPNEGIKPTPDLWNTANDRWGFILDELRDHQGPSLVTARLALQMVVDTEGRPTKEKGWNVLAQKNLPYDVGFVIQLRASYPERDNYLTGVRSLRFPHETDRKGKARLTALADDWSIDGIWRQLGLADKVAASRPHERLAAVDETGAAAARATLIGQIKTAAETAGVPLDQVAADWAASHNGQAIGETTDLGGLELLRDDLRAAPARQAVDEPAPAAPAQEPSQQPAEPPQAQEPPLVSEELIQRFIADVLKAADEQALLSYWHESATLGVRDRVVDVDGFGSLPVGQLIVQRRDQVRAQAPATAGVG